METPIANTIKRDAYSHYWLVDALRGPTQRGIVSSTTQDILHHIPDGVISSISKLLYTIYLCLCQAYFRLFEALLLFISRNTDSCFYRVFAMMLFLIPTMQQPLQLKRDDWIIY